jgi:hypothetical protein
MSVRCEQEVVVQLAVNIGARCFTFRTCVHTWTSVSWCLTMCLLEDRMGRIVGAWALFTASNPSDWSRIFAFQSSALSWILMLPLISMRSRARKPDQSECLGPLNPRVVGVDAY